MKKLFIYFSIGLLFAFTSNLLYSKDLSEENMSNLQISVLKYFEKRDFVDAVEELEILKYKLCMIKFYEEDQQFLLQIRKELDEYCLQVQAREREEGEPIYPRSKSLREIDQPYILGARDNHLTAKNKRIMDEHKKQIREYNAKGGVLQRVRIYLTR